MEHLCEDSGEKTERWEATNLRTQQHYELHYWRAWLHTHQTCSTKDIQHSQEPLFLSLWHTHTARHKNIIKEDTVVSVVSAIVYSHHRQFYKKTCHREDRNKQQRKKDKGEERRGRDGREQEMRRGWDQHRDSGSRERQEAGGQGEECITFSRNLLLQQYKC